MYITCDMSDNCIEIIPLINLLKLRQTVTFLTIHVYSYPQLPFDSCVLIGNYGMSRLVIGHGH
jgi:hypothetical protein